MEINDKTVQTEYESTFPKKKNNKGILIGIIIAAVIALVVAIGFGIYNSPENRLFRQLDLGQKYLEEQNYEQAVVAFNEAIEIDNKCVEAYIGLTETYIRMGEYDKALDSAKNGYDRTGDENLAEYRDKIESGNVTYSDGNNSKTTDFINDNKSSLSSSEGQSEIVKVVENTNSGEIQFDWSLDDWTINGIALSECDLSKVKASFGLNELEAWEEIDNWNGHEGVTVGFHEDADTGIIDNIWICDMKNGRCEMDYLNPFPTWSEISFNSWAADGGMSSQTADFSYITNVPYTAGDAETALAVFKIEDIINNGKLEQSYDDGRQKEYSFNSNLGSGYLNILTYEEEAYGFYGADYWLDIFTSEHQYEVDFTIRDGNCQARYICRLMGVTYSYD